MRFPDPYALRQEPIHDAVIYALHQDRGAGGEQQDVFQCFKDECFVIADGASGVPHGRVAAEFACETAVWAYKHVRQHRYYWLDKQKFMKRIFRSTNLAVWQKRKEKEYENGIITTLLVLMIGPKHIWIGNAGDSQVWMLQNGTLKKLTREKKVFAPIPQKALGVKRLGLAADFVSYAFHDGDVLLAATDGVADYLTLQDVQSGMTASGDTAEDLSRAAERIVRAAAINGSSENMTALMMKRFPG